MMQTLMVKLAPDKEQAELLLNLMHKFNEACNYIAETAFETKCANKIALQKILYYDVRKRFGLSAQHTIRAIAKAAEAYKRDKDIQPKFRETGAIVFDQRIFSWRKLEAVSMLTLKGRTIIPIRIGEYQKSRLDRIRGQVDLIWRNGVFYLAVPVETPVPSKFDPVGALGVDLGIVNLAVDSDGEVHIGKKIDETRTKLKALRSALKVAGTKSATRHLKKLGAKESRFHRDVNHCLSKKLVAKAKRTGRAISLEDLTGIRNQIRVRKAQRSRQHSWSFGQLRNFIEYKASLEGVPVIFVNPRGTSHICPKCGHEGKENRPTRDNFACSRCGFAGPADHVAAINIAVRAKVNPPIVAGNILGAICIAAVTSPHALAVGN